MGAPLKQPPKLRGMQTMHDLLSSYDVRAQLKQRMYETPGRNTSGGDSLAPAMADRFASLTTPKQPEDEDALAERSDDEGDEEMDHDVEVLSQHGVSVETATMIKHK